MDKIGLSFGPEVPLDGGSAVHLTPPLAGDAAKFEARACHCLCVRVHLCTGPVTLIHCSQKRETDLLWVNRMQQHVTQATDTQFNSPNRAHRRERSRRRLAAISPDVRIAVL